jgi:hypothetical protein
MSTLTYEASALDIWFDTDNMWVSLSDGRQLSVPLTFFPRLLNASSEERKQFEISGGGTGLHWDKIDEDISVPGLLLGYPDQTKHGKSL